MKPAIGYIRVSTAAQTEGVSLESQESLIRAWAQMQGRELVAIMRDDGISGCKLKNRPGINEAIRLACERKAPLVAYSLSRLFRSTREALQVSEQLQKAGADIVSLSEQIDTTTAVGKMVFRILAVLAEFERDLISERTKSALRYKKAHGECVGTVPYGWDKREGNLVENPGEQPVIKRILKDRANGATYADIAAALDKDGIPSKTNGQWHPSAVYNIVKSNQPTDCPPSSGPAQH